MMEHEKEPKLAKAKKPNFSNAEVAKLVERISTERDTIMSTCQDSVTLRSKQASWQRITEAVNAVGGQKRHAEHLKKKWRDLRKAVMDKTVQTGDSGDGDNPQQEIPCEDLIRSILQTSGHLIPDMDLDESSLGGEASFPDGTSIEVKPIGLDNTPYSTEGQSIVNGISTITIPTDLPATATTSSPSSTSSSRPTTTTTTTTKNRHHPFLRLGPKAMKKRFMLRRLRPATKVLYSSSASATASAPLSASPCSSVASDVDSEDVWLQWMRSEISKNAVKQQLMTEQLRMVRRQCSVVELQEKELVLKIRGLEQLQGNSVVSQLDSMSEQSDG